MKYPDYINLVKDDTIMALPKEYLEYFVRLYYYDNTDETIIPQTIPVENVEEYLIDRLTALNLFVAKGFATARSMPSEKSDNTLLMGDSGFHIMCHIMARVWYKHSVNQGNIEPNLSREEFNEECGIFKYGRERLIHL